MYDNYELDGTSMTSLKRKRATVREWVEGIIGMAAIIAFALVLLQLAAK